MGSALPQRLVMAFEIARAVETPLPDPDMSSPSNSLANLSFIMSSSKQQNGIELNSNHRLLVKTTLMNSLKKR